MQNFKHNLIKDEFILDDFSEFEKNKNSNKYLNRKKSSLFSNNKKIISDKLKRPLFKEETIFKLEEKYPEIFDIFEGDLDKFMDYCQDLINEMRNKKSDFEFQKMEENDYNNHNKNNEINDLSNMIIENIKNEGKLVRNKKIFYSNHETDKIFYINHIFEKYYENENSEMRKIYLENKIKEKNKHFKNSLTNPKIFESEKDIIKGNEKIFLKLVEFFLILMLFILFDNKVNRKTIMELSIFNMKILEIFNEREDCIEIFKKISSTKGLNEWMISCYLET